MPVKPLLKEEEDEMAELHYKNTTFLQPRVAFLRQVEHLPGRVNF